MPESIYHVTALYCGKPTLLFAGYASRVAKKLYAGNRKDLAGLTIAANTYPFDCARDRFGNAMPYTLWSGPIAIAEWVPTTIVIEDETHEAYATEAAW